MRYGEQSLYFNYLESVMSIGKYKGSSVRKLFSVQLLILPGCNHSLSGIHVIQLLDRYLILCAEEGQSNSLHRRDSQIRYIGGTVKFVTEEGQSNSLHRRDRQIRYRGETVNFVMEEWLSNLLKRRDIQFRYRGGTVKFVM